MTAPEHVQDENSSNPARGLPRKAPGGGINLLAKVRILDLTNSIAGPYATQILSDFGAEVIKIERPGQGDNSRSWGPPFLEGRSLWYASVNRNKKSIELDLRKNEGYAVFIDLLQTCDALVTNQLPSLRRRLRMDYETLAEQKTGLIYVSLTGYGSDGPRAEWPCYDIIAEGYSSVMDVTGEAENDPQKIGTPAADLLAGSDAAMACIRGAVRRRPQRTRTFRRHLANRQHDAAYVATHHDLSRIGHRSAPHRSEGQRDCRLSNFRNGR